MEMLPKIESFIPSDDSEKTMGLLWRGWMSRTSMTSSAYGAKDTRALKDFLIRAMNQWVKEPRYVLLVGDATFDPRDFMGMGSLTFVPTMIVQTTFFLKTTIG